MEALLKKHPKLNFQDGPRFPWRKPHSSSGSGLSPLGFVHFGNKHNLVRFGASTPEARFFHSGGMVSQLLPQVKNNKGPQAPSLAQVGEPQFPLAFHSVGGIVCGGGQTTSFNLCGGDVSFLPRPCPAPPNPSRRMAQGSLGFRATAEALMCQAFGAGFGQLQMGVQFWEARKNEGCPFGFPLKPPKLGYPQKRTHPDLGRCFVEGSSWRVQQVGPALP